MKKNKIFYGWWIVLGAAVILAVMGPASVAVANLYQPSVVAEFGIGNSQFAIVNTIVLGVGVVLAPYVSNLFSKGNFKKVYTIAIVLYAVAYFLYGLASNIYIFYILSLFVGYGFLATTIMPASILVTNWFIEKRGLALSLALSGLGIGGVIFSQLVTYLIENVGWRQTYMIYGVIMIVVCLPIVLFVFKRSPEDMDLEPLGSKEIKPSSDTEGEKEQKQKTAMPAKLSFTKPFFIMLIVGAVLVGISNNAGLGQFPPVLSAMHGAARMATVVSVYSAVGIIGKLVLGTINDRFGIVKSTAYACVLMVIAYLLMIFAGSYPIALLMAVFFGMGNAIGTVLPPLITSSIYSTENYAKAYGFVQSGVNLGMALGSLFAASIADFSGSYNYSWITLIVVCAVMGVLWISANYSSQKHLKAESAK